MLVAPLGDHTVLYDLVTEMVHVLNPTAALVWELCDGTTSRDELIDQLADVTSAVVDDVAADVSAYLAALADAGLVGRTTPVPEVDEIGETEVEGAHASAVFGVIDDGVVVRSDDPALIAAVDELLGSLAADRAVTVTLGLSAGDDDTVVLSGRGPARTYGSMETMLDALPTALNQIAADTSTCITLHSGCVRSPASEVVLLPAVSGSGKTTLTAALVRAGWGYVTDEAIGVRTGSLETVGYAKPLVLDATSREVLGLPPSRSPNALPTELRADVEVLTGGVGTVDRVVLPRYEAGASLRLTRLEPTEAVVAILEHALNLRRVGQPGLDAVCQLAEQIPVQHLVHGGVDDAVAELSRASS